MHRQASLAMGALAACAVIATGAVLLRDQILTFSAWPEALDGGRSPQIAIPDVRYTAAPAPGTAVRRTPGGSPAGEAAATLIFTPSGQVVPAAAGGTTVLAG